MPLKKPKVTQLIARNFESNINDVENRYIIYLNLINQKFKKIPNVKKYNFLGWPIKRKIPQR